MTIQILPDDKYMVLSTDAPIVGRIYSCEDAENGTGAQRRAWHALVQEYWRSGAHSYNAKSFEDFRNMIKRDLGAGFEAFVYILDGKLVDAKTMDEIPEHIRRDPARRDMIRGRLKSWADYTKKERRESIDRLRSEMDQVGVNTPKYREICEGLARAFA